MEPTTPSGNRADDRWQEQLLERLDAPMGALGVLFALLVLVETVSRPTGTIASVVAVLSWALWAVFVGEFVVRAVSAPSTSEFVRRNWWQLIFLALPFLRFLRFLRALRTIRRSMRVGRVISSMVRTGRSAGRRLGDRIGWLAVTTACVVVGASQIVYEIGRPRTYGDAVYVVALATISGEPLGGQGWIRVIDVALTTYSVVVFAALAGSFGSFLLERGADAPVANADKG